MFCCIVVFQFRQNLITEASIAAASKNMFSLSSIQHDDIPIYKLGISRGFDPG
jgi:hypothetical protein